MGGTAHIGSNPEFNDQVSGGTGRWSFKIDNPISAPIVADSTVFLGGWDYIYALDAVSGQVKWKSECVSSQNITANNENVYVDGKGQNEWKINSYDRETGDLRWSEIPSEGDVARTIAVDNDAVYAGAGNTVYSLDSNTGNVKWTWESSLDFTLVSIDKRDVYVGTENGEFYSLDKNTGLANELFVNKNCDFSRSVVIRQNSIYTKVNSMNIKALERESGEILWESGVPTANETGLSIGSEKLYMSTTRGGVYAIDLSNGEREWRFECEEQTEKPVVSDGRVYIPSRESCIYSVSADTGSVNWELQTGDDRLYTPALAPGCLYLSHGRQISAMATEKLDHSAEQTVEAEEPTTNTRIYQACSDCGADLSEHDTPQFCPSCGSEQ